MSFFPVFLAQIVRQILQCDDQIVSPTVSAFRVSTEYLAIISYLVIIQSSGDLRFISLALSSFWAGIKQETKTTDTKQKKTDKKNRKNRRKQIKRIAILTYGATFWSSRLQLQKYKTMLNRAQRKPLLSMTGAMRTTSTEKLILLTGLREKRGVASSFTNQKFLNQFLKTLQQQLRNNNIYDSTRSLH